MPTISDEIGSIERGAVKTTKQVYVDAKTLLSNTPPARIVEAGLGLVAVAALGPELVGSAVALGEGGFILNKEEGRVSTPLSSGTLHQQKVSRKDPAHILHRNASSIVNRVLPPQGSRPDSAILPPDESKSIPTITSKSSLPPLSAMTTLVSPSVPTHTPYPSSVTTGGSSPFS